MGTSLLLLSCLQLILLSRCIIAQQPNTDESIVSTFMQKLQSNSMTNFSSSAVCFKKGIECDSIGRVTTLHLTSMNFTGLIPDDTIGKLSKLQSLDLSNNRITALSSDFWSLGSALVYLNLSHNRISGPLPNNIDNFGRLQSLDLSGNNFSGSIPDAIGALLALQVLNLSRNSFLGEIPSDIINCNALVAVDLSHNKLNGGVPYGFGDHLPKLAVLDLARNEFTGNVSELAGLGSLLHLNLSENRFNGSSISRMLRNPLKTMDLSQNQFHGGLSPILFNPSSNLSTLVHLDLSQNSFNGELEGDVAHAPILTHLNLAQNQFHAHNFPRLANLTSLNYLNLSKTNLTGPIPDEIALFANLTALDLSANHLTGAIPDFNDTHIQILDLSRNNLSGEFPTFLIQKLSQMEKFNFSYNNFSLCASPISALPDSKAFWSLFYGSRNDCPIAVKPNPHRKNESKHRELMIALAIALSATSLAMSVVCLAFVCRRSRRSRFWAVRQLSTKEDRNKTGPFSFQTDSTTWVADVKAASSVPVVMLNKPLLRYTFADLLTATSHFNREALIAEGRLGPVYRGQLPEGTRIAAKVLIHGSAMNDEEAARELHHLGRIKHPNLVPLIGYCLAGEQRIVLYEYMENGSMQELLQVQDNESSRLCSLPWPARHKVALGTARALAFLHHGCSPKTIIHRDVKASSIYLDAAMEPRLSDFGLSKINNDPTSSSGSVYTAPELLGSGNRDDPTTKCDVYGFGVVLLELVTAKKVAVGDEVVKWVREKVRRKEGLEEVVVVDGGGEKERKEMVEALRIGYLCTAEVPSKRPDMQQVVGLLKDIRPCAGGPSSSKW